MAARGSTSAGTDELPDVLPFFSEHPETCPVYPPENEVPLSPGGSLLSSDEEALQERADAALIRMFLGGDRAAFEALVMRHQDRLYAFCFRYFRSQEPAEEAAQEVWVKIFRSLDRFRGESKFSTWMFQVALNHCRNRSAWEGRRGKGKHDSLDAERDLGEGPGLKMQLADEQPGADEQLEVDERRRILHEEMAQLDPIWMEILL